MLDTSNVMSASLSCGAMVKRARRNLCLVIRRNSEKKEEVVLSRGRRGFL
jgi:hypothetical protein